MALPSLAPPAPLRRPRVLVLGTVFATVAVLVAMAGMLGMYLLERGAVVSAGGTWVPEGATLPLTQPNVMLLGLVMSSVTMQWVLQAVRNDDRPNTYLAIGVTLMIGLAFVNMAFFLYGQMGLVLADDTSPAALLIYAITGSHVAMVIVAMLFLGLMGFRALGGQYTSRQYDGLAAAAVFWHASVVAFFFIWIAIYVTK